MKGDTKKPADKKDGPRLVMRLTPGRQKLYKAAAAKAELSMSAWVRNSLDATAKHALGIED